MDFYPKAIREDEFVPKDGKEAVEYIQKQFRDALDGFVGRPITSEEAQATMCHHVQKAVKSVWDRLFPLENIRVEARVKPDDPTSVEALIYFPECMIQFKVIDGTQNRSDAA